jgi:hypothetical protein
VPIRRPESAFMYSPEEQGTAGIPGYMPFTSHGLKPIDVYFMVLKPGKNQRTDCLFLCSHDNACD